MAEVLLTQSDEGKSIQVNPDDYVIVRLTENPTTGYSWAIDRINSEIVSPVASDYAADSHSGIGGGGRRVLAFKAVKAGSSPISLKLWRKWEGDKSVRQHFKVTIQVQGGEAKEV